MITEDILEWISTLPIWERKLGYYILDKKEITGTIFDEIYTAFKIESGLEEGSLEEEMEPPIVDEEKVPTVIWKGVCDIHGVNKLKTGPGLNVCDGLTIVYGENGSGKSGYTRLLNNAFISRGDQDILPNIYQSNPEAISAEFSFCIDGTPTILKFPESKGEYPFKTIRNFDSKSASDDMNKESTIDFAPSELLFFDEFLSVCTEIQKRLDEERGSKKIENPVLKYFVNEGVALEQMQNLTEKTNLEEIETLFTVSTEEKKKYEELTVEKARLIALDINKQILSINQVMVVLKKALEKYAEFQNAISEENIEIYNQQIEFLKKTKAIHDTDGLALFEENQIEQIGTSEWKEFIIAAKRYYDGINNHNNCPLCGHEITGDDLIYKYWKYLESDAENNLKVARQSIAFSISGMKELDLSFLLATSVQEQWLLENYKDETESISLYFQKANTIRTQIITALENEEEIPKFNIDSEPLIQELIDKIDEKKKSFNQDAVNARIDECTRFENEYVDKTKVLELIPIIQSYIDYLKWDSLAEKSKIKSRAITNKQKALFEKYVTEDYIKTFINECGKLMANFDVDIVSRGSSGQTLKKLQIKGKAPGKVLSEGEQRAISIANFLTEVQMDIRNIAIVLDDPVCSLDHKRRTFIVNRLLEEAKKRQVIVFTHEITFFMELKTEAERNGVLYEQETIRKICNEPGDISSVIPWQGMNVKDRIGKLKNDLQGIAAIFNSGDMDTYYYRAKEWCELLRESWERAVEEILFNDAIQRYNPCVQTQRLKKAPFTQNLYLELERGMTECSAWCHDQARAINGKIPTLDELKGFIECFESYCKKNRVK